MANKRIFYACEAVGVAPNGTNTFTALKGLQSVGISTKFNLEQIFQIGQLAIYQNCENLPDIEVTLEKVLDGNPLIYHHCTYGAPDASLVGRSNQRATVAMSLFSDLQNSASGAPFQQVTCSGMFVSSLTYDVKVEGNATESVTLVGNNKRWAIAASGNAITFSGGFNNNASPLAAEGVNRRQHLVMANCLFPPVIPGISVAGVNALDTDGFYKVHFQSARVSVNLGREQMLELGHKAAYFRYVNFPVEVRTDFEIIDTQGDLVNAEENGIYANGRNLGTGDHIFLEFQEGTKIELGTKNLLSSVSFGGANAGNRGGNATSTFSFITYNDCVVTHPQDPTGALAA